MPSLKGPIIAVVLLPLFSLAMYQAALEVQAGGVREFHGRNAAIKNFLYSFGGTLGPIGCITVGTAVTLLSLYWFVKTVQKRRQRRQALEST